MIPDSIPIVSFSTLASGARQFVVHEAFETTLCSGKRLRWFTP